MNGKTAAVVLAAGKGTRLNATKDRNKVTFQLAEKPMVVYSVDNLVAAGFSNITVVVGFASESVKKALGNRVTYQIQENPEGTGHALMVGMKGVPGDVKTVFSLYGDDSAFYPPKLYESLYHRHQEEKAVVTLLTIEKEDPAGLGRIIRNQNGEVVAIVEEKNANEAEKKIKEINTGLYCFNREFLDQALKKIKRNEISGEFYLTDIVELACKENKKVTALFWQDQTVWFGVNTLEQLDSANEAMISLKQSAY